MSRSGLAVELQLLADVVDRLHERRDDRYDEERDRELLGDLRGDERRERGQDARGRTEHLARDRRGQAVPEHEVVGPAGAPEVRRRGLKWVGTGGERREDRGAD